VTDLPVATPWFEAERLSDSVWRVTEPAAHRLMRANMFLIEGRYRACLFDTGLGVADLQAFVATLTSKPIVVVTSHTHLDHIGAHHQFQGSEILVHPREAGQLLTPEPDESLSFRQFGATAIADLVALGFRSDSPLIEALPSADFDIAGFRCRGVKPTGLVAQGDRIDLGDRVLDVHHLPGHSPGSIGLIDAARGEFFSGDAIYDGILIDSLPGSDPAAYRDTMRRIALLPVTTVYGGHNRPFGRQRMIEIAEAYLAG
jgi:glyoxylase-like metal-dependent hydrolase (beta-lactamase superfamily II)